LGALLAIGVLWGVRVEFFPKLVTTLSFVPFALARVDEGRLALELLAAGGVVGIAGAWFSVSRHLRA
ncbi:MAG: hypothetical protein JOY59_01740, partial [Candidatus Eremiobacteraeota bacterium]|nr:hypothetical protein [Candidatus Eremiobacteraeota bacterium]